MGIKSGRVGMTEWLIWSIGNRNNRSPEAGYRYCGEMCVYSGGENSLEEASPL